MTISAVLLSAAGIYALMSFTITRRRREIGIRSALGAGPRRVLGGVLSRVFVHVSIGIAIGVAVADCSTMCSRAAGRVVAPHSFCRRWPLHARHQPDRRHPARQLGPPHFPDGSAAR